MTILLQPVEKAELRSEIISYIDKHCVFRANPEVIYADEFERGLMVGPSWKPLTKVFMLRRLTHNPEMLNKVAIYLFDEIMVSLKNNTEFPQFQFAGLETASIPLITGLQMYAKGLGLDINAFTVRKERKPYGIFQLIEGIPNNAPVMLIDDLVNSGTSFYTVMSAIHYELELTATKKSYSIVEYGDGPYVHDFDVPMPSKHVAIVKAEDFTSNYDPAKAWIPKDCDKLNHVRLDYK